MIQPQKVRVTKIVSGADPWYLGKTGIVTGYFYENAWAYVRIEDANGRKLLPGASKPGNVHDLVREVSADKGRFAELDAEVRKAFAKTKPLEVTDDGEVIE